MCRQQAHQHVKVTVEMKLSRGSTSVQVHGRGFGVPRPPKSPAFDATAKHSSNTARQGSEALQSAQQCVQKAQQQLLPTA
jgi:hypothetical protein